MQDINSTKADEARARRAAKRVGLRAIKSRRSISGDNFGDFIIVDPWLGNFVIAGSRFDYTPDEVIEFCKNYE